jgi:hypothetical protein
MNNFSDKFAFFIISSDKTSDILSHSLVSYKKNIKNDYQFFIGANNNTVYKKISNATPIFVVKSNWKNETIHQINIIKKRFSKIKKILVLLDDFVINEHVNRQKLNFYINLSFKKNLNYLGLRSLKNSVFSKFNTQKKDILEIHRNYPYYFSLQAAIWDIDYFLVSLKRSKSIWDFETMKSNKKHYCVNKTFIQYLHIVEKGRWIFYAKNFCLKNLGFFNPGGRKGNYSLYFIFKYILTRFLTYFFGQQFYKLNK